MVGVTSACALLLALYASVATAVNSLKVSGADFVDSVSNKRFEILGVAYQPGGSAGFIPQNGVDPLSNGTTCLRDAIIMQTLGVNCIRIYNLDPQLNHDDCASVFNAAGIYMIIDVNSPLPNQSLDAADPSSSYDKTYLERIFQVVEAFKGYQNLLGFFAGNEDVNDLTSGKIDPPYIRAVTRDLKNYVAKHGGRDIPVGYSAADVRPVLFDTWEYLQCALDGDAGDMSRVDFFGLNSYSWCGQATLQSSTYSQLIAGFANTTVPIFFSEYGCNKVAPRQFSEVAALYSPAMRAIFSGGLVYEWTQETNDFGLVQVNDNSTVSLLVDFDNLQSQYSKLDIPGLEAANSTAAALAPPRCSSDLIPDSGFAQSFDIPNTPPGGSDLISAGVSGGSTGKMVPVTNTAIPVTVYATNGQPVTGLQLHILANGESNVPSNTSTSPSSTGSSSSATSSSAAIPALWGVTEQARSGGLLLAAVGLTGALFF